MLTAPCSKQCRDGLWLTAVLCAVPTCSVGEVHEHGDSAPVDMWVSILLEVVGTLRCLGPSEPACGLAPYCKGPSIGTVHKGRK